MWGVYCNHLVGTLLQNPKMGEPKTLDPNRRGVGLRARGFGPIPLASKQASKQAREQAYPKAKQSKENKLGKCARRSGEKLSAARKQTLEAGGKYYDVQKTVQTPKI